MVLDKSTNRSASSAVKSYAEGFQWIIGLSAAATAGAFLHIKELGQQSLLIRWLAASAVLLFFLSIWSGINYMLWLNVVDVDKEGIAEIDSKLIAFGTTDPEKADLQRRREKHEKRIARSRRVRPYWYRTHVTSSSIATLLSAIVVMMAIVAYRKPPAMECEAGCGKQKRLRSMGAIVPPPANHFLVAYSAAHHGRHGTVTHTFLIDQQTGEMWQMICQPGDRIAFRRIRRIESH
jgi:hypothetical protein